MSRFGWKCDVASPLGLHGALAHGDRAGLGNPVYFRDGDLLRDNQDPLIITAAPYGPSIGIIKDNPFAPSDRQRELLEKAALTAPTMIIATRLLGRDNDRH